MPNAGRSCAKVGRLGEINGQCLEEDQSLTLDWFRLLRSAEAESEFVCQRETAFGKCRPVVRLGGKIRNPYFEQLNRLSQSFHCLIVLVEVMINSTDSLLCSACIQSERRVGVLLLEESMVELQSVFQQRLSNRLHLGHVGQLLVGNAGQHLVHRLAGLRQIGVRIFSRVFRLLPLRLGLFPLFVGFDPSSIGLCALCGFVCSSHFCFMLCLRRTDRLPGADDCAQHQRYAHHGCGQDPHRVAAGELVESVRGRRWTGLHGFVVQVPLHIRCETIGRFVAAVAVLFQGLHHNPVELAPHQLRQLGWFHLPLC